YLFLYIFILLFFFFSFLLPLLTSTLFPYTTLFRSYGLVRSLKPRRYVEVGCGWSSLLLQKALQKNDSEGASTEVALVEPYPNEKDRKSTRLNSSHVAISYAVFCLNKKT